MDSLQLISRRATVRRTQGTLDRLTLTDVSVSRLDRVLSLWQPLFPLLLPTTLSLSERQLCFTLNF